MKNLLYILLICPCFLIAQKLKPILGFSFNSGLEKVEPVQKALDVVKVNSFGYYVSLGFNLSHDSTFLFYSGIRFGLENSRFLISSENRNYEFRTTNLPLTFIFAPGVRLSKRQSLFLTLGICRVLQANNGGGGGGSRKGKEYTYIYADNLPPNSWDFRPGIKYQVKPRFEKKLAFEFGVEPSLLTRTLDMELKNTNPNLPSKIVTIHYDLILFYLGVQF